MSDNNDEATDAAPAPHRTPTLLRNYISFIGIAISAASFTSFVLLLLVGLNSTENPYTDLITFIFVPSILAFGLFVILAGVLWERRRRRLHGHSEIAAYPVLDLNDPRRRRSLIAFMCLSFVFLFLTAFGSYRAFEYTESVAFCGLACHNVMKPEFVAYNASPHAKVKCVECHVGGGAEAYVRSKFTGMRQLYGVVTGHFNRPIQTPVRNMRAATETCQQCHWAEKYHGDVIKVFNHYEYDENNSLNQTRMLIKVGGGNPAAGPVGGIHWHMNVANEITIISTDEKRQNIPWVRMKDLQGRVLEYKTAASGISPQEIERSSKRRMDCIDCHSRPAHNYLSPNQAVDQSFAAGRLDITLPYLKAKAVETLAKPYTTEDEAVSSISSEIQNYYQVNYADIYKSNRTSVDGAVSEIQQIYKTYFFPEMKTDWKASFNNIGHYNAQGCFRCHDGQHVSNDGQVIRNECSTCHTTLDQSFGGRTTASADGMFRHPVNLGDKNTWQCAACHKGDQTFRHPINLGDISRFQCAECHKSESAGQY
jgi:hypothetical protein